MKEQQIKTIEYKGNLRRASDLCRENSINRSTFNYRIRNGVSVEDALKTQFDHICVICGKEFKSKRQIKKYCSPTCTNRGKSGKGAYKQPYTAECVVCGKQFETIRDDAKTCSRACRFAVNNKKRKDYFRELKRISRYDPSITVERVYQKYHGDCNECGKHLTFNTDYNGDDYPTIDHVIPLSKGGVHEWNNVQLLCRKCNVYKKAS